ETKDTGAVILTVALDENGNYSFKTADDKYLTIDLVEKESNGKTKTYANLTFKDTLTDNGLWTEVAADDTNSGKYYLKNSYAKVGSSQQALEYYSGFSAYGFKEDPIYAFNFYALAEGEKTVKLEYEDERLTVGQWAGNAHYNEYEECATTIYGDKYATNDLLDKTAKYTAVVGGVETQPWTSAKSTTTGSTSYYMGSTGVANASTDYMQFELSTLGYGNLGLEFRMRASNTAAGSFQLQYSTDGENFKNFKTGTYSYKYTAYKNSGKQDENGKAVMEQYEVNGSGDITDGIAKTSLAPTYYVNFTFDIPNAAANAEKVYIRLVPGELSAKGDKAPSKGGVIRMDGVVVKGNPVIDNTRTRFVVANPTSGEVANGEKIALTSLTEGADVYYSVNGSEFTKYDSDEKVTLDELPATVQAYAVKDGLEKSITVSYMYTQAQVAAVKATPNGGAVIDNQKVTLKSKTEGATILYRYLTDEEIAAADANTTDNASTDENADSEATEPTEQVEEHDDWITYTGSFELKSLPSQIQVKATKEGYKDSAVATVKFTKRLNDKYNIYFGQIHAHTNISDGAGSLEDALKHATNVDNLDYIVITDHSNSIDNEKESKITENVDKSAEDEWTYAHNLVKQYSTDKFTCAYGYEMTWSNGLGHMNTYNTPGFQSRTQTEFSTYSTALQNYYAALRTVPDSISQFNHPGTTFGDFSDFAYYSEENDNLITMIEVGNGEGTIGSSGYFPSYEYYTRALDKGWHVAPTNNQDNHKGKWGDANTARTVMLADVNDENAIYDAMRNYRIYATEDNDLSIYYTLNSYIMGTILEKDAVDDTVEIKADIKDPTDSKIGRVEVIVNGGQSIAMENVSTNDTTVTFNVPSSYSYYYLKITEDDGDIAVTAPVWVGEVEACGINKTYTNTVLPVKGESLDVNVDLYNNESSDLKVDFVDVVLKDVDGKETEVAALTGEEAGVPSVAAKGTATFKTDYVYNEAGQVTYEITVRATLNGVPKVYTDKLTVNYALPSMIADIVIDGTHYNDYVTGYYGGNVNAFIKLCAAKNIRATVVKDEITAETLKNCKLLVVSAPAKKSGTANAGDYTVSHYSDDFIALVKDYVENGGSVAVCGWADYSDSSDCQTATEQNKLLSAIGATIRMGSDEVCDDKNNGGQVYRMYPTNVNLDSELLAGFKEGQKYSQYSGCSVDISNAKANDFVDAAEWLVKGY
ncbi:MAG: CehA/McbA family metallohydrolase, partial [Pseudobutyrivibrio sp.]|nr:CehA/McbA family metallohydrolase [Pseudobutyrivibrio sp.]